MPARVHFGMFQFNAAHSALFAAVATIASLPTPTILDGRDKSHIGSSPGRVHDIHIPRSGMLSATSQYALRAMACLAMQPEGAVMLGRSLSSAADIPAAYLTKILVDLRNAGLVDTVRGTGGGYRLRKPAEKIFLVDIVELFDGPQRNTKCLLGHDKNCTDDSPCSAHRVWRDIRTAYTRMLVSTSLAEIAANHTTISARQPQFATVHANGGSHPISPESD